ncbi:MAG: hypothetical protein ACYDDV_10700 [Methanoregula sp.]
MKKSVSLGIAVLTLLLLAALLVLPVSGAVDSPATTPVKPFISVGISPVVPVVGDTAYVSGVAEGGNLTAGVQIWVFAGNYINVTTVPIKADGYSFLQSYQTAHLPPATYYVFVQSPATDGQFDIDFIESGKYTGEVVNTRTNTMIFNFTGVGSVNDKDAMQALSDALNQPGMDDVYSKAAFQLVAPGAIPFEATTTPAVPATTATTAAATTAKSPLPVEVTAGALVISGCCAAFCMRKTH